MTDSFKYFAFISYSSHDTSWGKRLHNRLEYYRLPSTLCSKHGLKRIPMRPIFFAPTDIQPGGLNEELKSRLRASRNLVVICSPNSAQSKWVGEEIKYFHELGRTDNIHFFIVRGTPHSANPDEECINPIVDELGIPEILGANIHEKTYALPLLNKERAYAQLISKLLGIEFDTIWKRHKRQLTRKVLAWTFGITAVVCAFFAIKNANQSFDMEINFDEVSVHNTKLPPIQQVIVSLQIDGETRHDTLSSTDETASFKGLQHSALKTESHLYVTSLDANMQRAYYDLDTTLRLNESLTLPLRRDPDVYGHVFFEMVGEMVPTATIRVGEWELSPDSDGLYSIHVPIEKQMPKYGISGGSATLSTDTIYMPCFEGNVVRVIPR